MKILMIGTMIVGSLMAQDKKEEVKPPAPLSREAQLEIEVLTKEQNDVDEVLAKVKALLQGPIDGRKKAAMTKYCGEVKIPLESCSIDGNKLTISEVKTPTVPPNKAQSIQALEEGHGTADGSKPAIPKEEVKTPVPVKK